MTAKAPHFSTYNTLLIYICTVEFLGKLDDNKKGIKIY